MTTDYATWLAGLKPGVPDGTRREDAWAYLKEHPDTDYCRFSRTQVFCLQKFAWPFRALPDGTLYHDFPLLANILCAIEDGAIVTISLQENGDRSAPSAIKWAKRWFERRMRCPRVHSAAAPYDARHPRGRRASSQHARALGRAARGRRDAAGSRRRLGRVVHARPQGDYTRSRPEM